MPHRRLQQHLKWMVEQQRIERSHRGRYKPAWYGRTGFTGYSTACPARHSPPPAGVTKRRPPAIRRPPVMFAAPRRSAQMLRCAAYSEGSLSRQKETRAMRLYNAAQIGGEA